MRDSTAKYLKHKTNVEKWCNLLDAVDDHSNEAVQYSLMQVAKSFPNVLRSLVPSAIGRLEWSYDEQEDDSSFEEDEEEPRVSYLIQCKSYKGELFFNSILKVRFRI